MNVFAASRILRSVGQHTVSGMLPPVVGSGMEPAWPAPRGVSTVSSRTLVINVSKVKMEMVGNEHQSLKAHLPLTERPHIPQHLPGFFFRQDERNKGSHRRALAAILQNPEQFPIGSSCLPLLVGEISR